MTRRPWCAKAAPFVRGSRLDGISEAVAERAREWIASLEASERRRSGIKSLKVGFKKSSATTIEITHANNVKLPDNTFRKQTLTGAERYLTPELKEREAVVLTAQERIAGSRARDPARPR